LFLEVISGTSFDRRYRDYGRRMVERDFEPAFSLALGLKDVELAREAAAENGMALPTADLLRDQHVAAIAAGFGEKDWAALGEFIARRAGLA
jgi:3-hydroxyisobutyrate dehydrogenase-like beta-hydroxyacid dehydrogenase